MSLGLSIIARDRGDKDYSGQLHSFNLIVRQILAMVFNK